MRCKRHSLDSSSNIGVCASCLRERLISLAASTAASQNDVVQQQQPPLVFPRSVSPYVAPRKSSSSSRDSNNTRFFSTPQVGPTKNQSCGGGGGGEEEPSSSSEEKIRSFVKTKKKKKQSHLSRFSKFFRTRSDVYDSRNMESREDSFSTPSSSSSSKSWLSKILFVKSKKDSVNSVNTCYIEDLIESESNSNQPRQRFCRGMSPSESQRRTPVTMTPGRRKTPARLTGLGRSVSEMGFCLSPLVRAKPTNWRGKYPPSEYGFSGELMKSPVKPHISTAASFCANRSKKLADLGRVDPRR